MIRLHRVIGGATIRILAIMFIGAGVFLHGAQAQAIEMGELQAAIVMRALSYDDALKGRVGEQVVVGMALPVSNPASCDDLRQGFSRVASLKVQGLGVRLVELPTTSVGALEEAIKTTSADVVVLCSTVMLDLATVLDVTRRLKVASVAMNQDWVRAGVSLGVGEHDNGKAKLFVNVASSQAEGMTLRPELLRVAVIIK